MAVIRAQVELPSLSGLPKDVAINTWHFETLSDTPAAIETGMDEVQAFMENFYAFIDGMLSGTRATPATLSQYILADPEPRVPRRITDLNLTYGGVGFPNEVAICLSFKAAPAPGVTTPGRRRGRVFLGPLSGSGGVNAGDDLRPTAAFMEQLLDAYESSRLLLSLARHVVWSRMDDLAWEVEVAWVDNAWDTIRSRGADPTARDTRTLTPVLP